MESRKQWDIQKAKGKKKPTCQPRIIYLTKLSFKNDDKIKTSPDKQKQKFVSTRPT